MAQSCCSQETLPGRKLSSFADKTAVHLAPGDRDRFIKGQNGFVSRSNKPSGWLPNSSIPSNPHIEASPCQVQFDNIMHLT